MLEHSRSFKNRLGKAKIRGSWRSTWSLVRAMEQRVERTSQWTHRAVAGRRHERAGSSPSRTRSPQEYIRCMYDLVVPGIPDRLDAIRDA